MNLPVLKLPVISYCDIPEEISEEDAKLQETSPDSYIKIEVISKEKQRNYDSDFSLENWIIDEYPELEGNEVLIHIDY